MSLRPRRCRLAATAAGIGVVHDCQAALDVADGVADQALAQIIASGLQIGALQCVQHALRADGLFEKP